MAEDESGCRFAAPKHKTQLHKKIPARQDRSKIDPIARDLGHSVPRIDQIHEHMPGTTGPLTSAGQSILAG